MSKSTLLILLFISFATALNTAVAKDLDDAVSAMRTGDFAEAYCIMRPLAESGDADSQYNIGWMYVNGYGLRVNDGLSGRPVTAFSTTMKFGCGSFEFRYCSGGRAERRPRRSKKAFLFIIAHQ